MKLVRWEPFGEPLSLKQAMDRLFEESFIRPSRALSLFGEAGAVPIDMYQTDSDVVVKATLPGVKPDEVDIHITGDTLSIRGESKEEKEIKREDYIYQEHRYGAFARSITLPSGLQADKAEAAFEDGILTLTIPKSEAVKPKTIKVKAKGTDED